MNEVATLEVIVIPPKVSSSGASIVGNGGVVRCVVENVGRVLGPGFWYYADLDIIGRPPACYRVRVPTLTGISMNDILDLVSDSCQVIAGVILWSNVAIDPGEREYWSDDLDGEGLVPGATIIRVSDSSRFIVETWDSNAARIIRESVAQCLK